MSKKKHRSPQEKKALSYAKDRRNSYFENDKASRKLIPLRKAAEHRQGRRMVAQKVALLPKLEEFDANVVESSIRHEVHRIGSWRKSADEPLREAVTRLIRRRKGQAEPGSHMLEQQVDGEDPSRLRRLAHEYRQMVRELARTAKIGRNSGDTTEFEQICLKKAQAFEDRADEIIRQRAEERELADRR